MRIFLDGYGSKIRKVNRWRPTVSNATNLTTKQEFFFTKVAPVQSITDIVLLGFWLILLLWMFISSYIYFFVNNFSFRCLCFSKYDIRMFIFAFRLRNRLSLSTYATERMEGDSSKMCAGAYRGRGVSPHLECTYALTLSLFMFLWYGALFYL